MKDQTKTKTQLIEELTTLHQNMAELRQRVAELEASAIGTWQTGETLLSSEERFRRFILSLSDHIYVTEVTETGRRVNLYLSPNAAKLTGYSEAQLMTDWSFWPSRIIHPDDQAAVAVQAAQLARGQNSEVEYRLIRADGQSIWVRDSARVELVGTSKIVYGVVTDITERKHREVALTRLLGLSRALVTQQSPTRVFDQAIKAATEIAPAADRGSLQLLDEAGETLRTVAISSPDETLGDTIIFQPGVGIAGHALANNQTINVPDVLADERFIPSELPLRLRSLLVAPLVVKGRLLGTLSLSSQKIGAFSAADEVLVQLIADQVAAALENARLFASYAQAEELRRAHKFLQATIDGLASHIAILDENGRIIAVNAPWRYYAEVNDYSHPNYGIGANYLEICDSATGPSAEPAPLVAAGVRQVMAGQRDQFYLEYPAPTPLAQQWFGVRITRFLNDGAIWVVVAHEDVTERRVAEEALRANESRFRSLIQNSSDIITLLTADGTIQYVSPPVERILGHLSEAVVGQNIFSYIHPDDLPRVRTRFNEIVRCPGIDDTPTEFRICSASGTWLWLESVSNNLLDDPNVQGVVVNARDISQRKQVEEELRLLEAQFLQAQKMEAIGRLAGGVAHDFNNLLTVIKGYADLLLFRLGKRNTFRHYIEEISKATDQAALLTHRLLIFSRQEMAQPEVINLNTVVADIEKMLKRLIGEDIELVTSLEPDLGRVKANPGHIEQVTMNLVINARDAMPQGGRLTIETANITLDEIAPYQPMAVQPGQYVRLTVSDTGVGMDEQTLNHIFEPFYTTKEPGKGTGLGLSTVYAIVTQSKGSIQVFSQPGKGTTFNIYLPLLTDPIDPFLQQQKSEDLSAMAGKKNETILLVEDQAKVRAMVKRVLQGHGYRVLEARHGNEALQICLQSQEPIHLILTDVVMPGGISGRELVDRVKPLLPKTKVIYMSGYTNDVTVRHGVLHSTINFLQKPFAPNILLTKVREVLDTAE
jgi:PAS domain S-box-containing protein